MPDVTPKGLPFPLSTDPLMDGAAAIQALAEALDPLIGAATVGDYKVSAQAADHGAWLLCDGSPIDPTLGDAIALLGPNRPDGRGRMLVMQGGALGFGANEGQPNPLLRKPQHFHQALYGNRDSGPSSIAQQYNYNQEYVVVGDGSGPRDTPAFVVPGNLFVYGGEASGLSRPAPIEPDVPDAELPRGRRDRVDQELPDAPEPRA